jgi:hypothetical protein
MAEIVQQAPAKPPRPPYVCIYASQVAVCIGANKHKKVSEAVDAMWQRISPHSYYAALERNGLKTDDQNVTEIMAKHLDIKTLVDRSLTLPCDSSDQVAAHYDLVSRDLESAELGEDEKRLVDDVLKRNLYTTYGNLHEHHMLAHIRDTLGIKCRPDPTFYKQLGGTCRGVPWYVGGKIDAINEDRTLLIEIKNRVNRLFNRVPFYEVIQVQTYLHLLGVEQGALVECLKSTTGGTAGPLAGGMGGGGGGKDTAPGGGGLSAPTHGVHCGDERTVHSGVEGGDSVHVNVIPIRRDHELWKRSIMPKLDAFVDFLLRLLDDPKLQDRYMSSKRRSVLVLNHMSAWARALASAP